MRLPPQAGPLRDVVFVGNKPEGRRPTSAGAESMTGPDRAELLDWPGAALTDEPVGLAPPQPGSTGGSVQPRLPAIWATGLSDCPPYQCVLVSQAQAGVPGTHNHLPGSKLVSQPHVTGMTNIARQTWKARTQFRG